MTHPIKTAFEAIQAEDALKEGTLARLGTRAQAGGRARRNHARRFAALAACLFLAVTGLFSYHLYFMERAYIDFDINPSLELTVNPFRRVIGARAYNADGEALLSGVNIRHKSTDEAVEALIAAAAQSGALEREGLVSVTVQALSGDEAKLLERIHRAVAASVSHHGTAQVDVFSVDSDLRDAAHGLHISPAKYLAILELQEVDPTATVDACRAHSIGEIRQWTQAHAGDHHGQGGSRGESIDSDAVEPEDMPASGHHGEKGHG